MKKPNKVIPYRSEKYCNICGNSVGIYQVIDNGIVCFDCVPEQKVKKSKKIMNENQMLTKVLEYKK